MRKDYSTVIEVSLSKQKKYLLNLCSHGRIEWAIYQCFSQRQLNKIIKNKQVNQDLYHQAVLALYQCHDFETLEYHLTMMNLYFHYQSYIDIKKQLFYKICKKKVTLQEYCVLRHLVDFKNLSFEYFVEQLHSSYGTNILDCAKICLLEDQYKLAYEYLKQLDDCNDENVLQLLCSYSLYDYISLKRYYHQKKEGYILLLTN